MRYFTLSLIWRPLPLLSGLSSCPPFHGWSFKYDPPPTCTFAWGTQATDYSWANLDIPCRTNVVRKDSGCWCNLNLKIVSPKSGTRDFTVVGRYNYLYAVKAYIKLNISRGVSVVVPPLDRDIPGSTPKKYNFQIEITSKGI